MADDTEEQQDEPPATPLERLRAQLLARWRAFPEDQHEALDALLAAGLDEAEAAPAEVITVMNPVSRPARLRLAALVSDAGLDRMYRQEWAELSVSDRGHCYLVYRRRDGARYAIEWSPATSIPESMMSALPDVLALAMLDGDTDASS